MKSCLIIDDEPDKVDVMKKRLEGCFDRIDSVGTLKEGMEAASVMVYEFIMLDIQLPDANGLDSAEAMKAICPASEIILVTAYSRRGDASKLISDRIVYYIVDALDEMKLLPDLIELKRSFKEMRANVNA
jgi:CheY-like chemotaxis protein